MSDRMPLAAAALKLSLTYQQVRTLLLRGHLGGGRDEFGRFYVHAAEVERFTRERAQTGRSA